MADRVRCILFDAAGTLIEPAEPVAATYRRHFAAQGWRLDEAALSRAFRDVFASLPEPDFSTRPDGEALERVWWRTLVAEVGRRAGAEGETPRFDRAFESLFEHYRRGNAWRWYPEALGVLRELKARGVRLAIVSNFDRRLHQVIGELGGTGYFEGILTSADAGARKPSPLLIRKALETLGVAAGETLLAGDNREQDGAAAEAAGIRFFHVDRPARDLAGLTRFSDAGNF